MYLLLLLEVLLLWRAQRFVFRRNWARELSARLEFEDTHIYEGDTSVLKEILVNDKHFPLPAIHVRLTIPRDFVFLNEGKENTSVSDQTYKRDIFSFIGRQQITRRLHFTATRRGYYEIKQVDVTGSDFFFREGQYLPIPQNTAIYVFPKQISTARIRLLCRDISGSVISQDRLHPDPFAFSGIREYQKSDPMNHVNWKATARMGDLMVNQYDSTTNRNVTLALDVEDSKILKQEPLVEECIRITSSLAGNLVTHKMPVRVCSNALRPDHTPLDRNLPAGGGHMLELNQELACIDSASLTDSGAAFIRSLSGEKQQEGRTYVILSGNHSEEMQEAVRKLAENHPVIWVIPVFEDEEREEIRLPLVQIIPWEVARW